MNDAAPCSDCRVPLARGRRRQSSQRRRSRQPATVTVIRALRLTLPPVRSPVKPSISGTFAPEELGTRAAPVPAAMQGAAAAAASTPVAPGDVQVA